jgi:hypothetical protein
VSAEKEATLLPTQLQLPVICSSSADITKGKVSDGLSFEEKRLFAP